ncbi:hypothetical protein LWI28_015741 [Acer negundo]|uniref:Uncharacterized protein n=1 Tax=Acer negundo TaxID=4023 RepID=A0AAD5IFF6_ACENE|nr:hypothetical protein LWI28_015741 [Acer negundo]
MKEYERRATSMGGSISVLGEGVSNESEATKDELVLAMIAAEKKGNSKADGARGVIEDSVFLSSENFEMREEMIQATVEVDKRREHELRVADSDEDVVLATLVAEYKLAHSKGGVNGSSHGIRQSSRIKSKGSISHSKRTRKAKHIEVAGVLGNQVTEPGSVEKEVANVMAIGSTVGFDFLEVEEEVLEEIARREEEDLARFAAIYDVINSLDCCSVDPLEVVPRNVDGEVISKAAKFIDKRVKSKVIRDSNQLVVSTRYISRSKSIDCGKEGRMYKSVVWFLKISIQKMSFSKGKGKMVHFSTSKFKSIHKSNGKLLIGKDFVGFVVQNVVEEKDSSTSKEELSR